MEEMLKNEDIICFSSIDWDFIWQGHQEIMAALARAGNRVLFVENTGVRGPRPGDYDRIISRLRNWWKGYKGIRRVERNLYVYSPMALPFPYNRAARWVNRRLIGRVLGSWCRSQQCSAPILWSFLPTRLTLELCRSLPRGLLVYYCIDSFADSSPAAARIVESERELIAEADLVFVTSEQLREHCAPHARGPVHKFPFTVHFERFEPVLKMEHPPCPPELEAIPEPRVGYIGGLHRWLDQELVAELAAAMPEASFVFVGPEQEPMQRLKSLPNVHLLGGRPHDQLPFYLRQFQAGIIPYRRTGYTDNVYPTKLNEYLALGLPVAATPIRELELFAREHPGLVDLCADAQSMAAALRLRLAPTGRGSAEGARLVRERIELARENSWTRRLERMCALIREEIDRGLARSEPRWRARLAGTFSSYRRRSIGLAAAGLLAWAALFWSPLVYWVGAPLRVEEPPSPSAVILVFGGGVGEGGRPGRSTMERAALAAELYHRGLAPKIVFSSGYQQFRDRDAEDMQRVAQSRGVPAADILLEDRAASNYENVVRCLELMKQHHWRSAIVISGRYNMRRTGLLLRRQLRELELEGSIGPDSLHLVPVRENIFFHPREGDRLAQWRAILHEYLAIADYYRRGLL